MDKMWDTDIDMEHRNVLHSYLHLHNVSNSLSNGPLIPVLMESPSYWLCEIVSEFGPPIVGKKPRLTRARVSSNPKNRPRYPLRLATLLLLDFFPLAPSSLERDSVIRDQ